MSFDKATLRGRTIAVPESRELDVFAGLLERRGARVVRCPLITIRDAPDPKPIIEWARDFIRGCDDLILLTGEGVHRLLACIESNEPELRASFLAQLARVRKITRGPKPARALRELGLQSDLAAEVATTEGIIKLLHKENLRGHRVSVQLYGVEPNVVLIEFLESAGAIVTTVAPYIYATAADDESVHRLANQLQSGAIDAIAFTSMQQVKRFFDVLGDATAKKSLAHTMIAAIGPVVANALEQRGVQVELTPQDSFFLKPLTRALEERLGAKNISD